MTQIEIPPCSPFLIEIMFDIFYTAGAFGGEMRIEDDINKIF